MLESPVITPRRRRVFVVTFDVFPMMPSPKPLRIPRQPGAIGMAHDVVPAVPRHAQNVHKPSGKGQQQNEDPPEKTQGASTPGRSLNKNDEKCTLKRPVVLAPWVPRDRTPYRTIRRHPPAPDVAKGPGPAGSSTRTAAGETTRTSRVIAPWVRCVLNCQRRILQSRRVWNFRRPQNVSAGTRWPGLKADMRRFAPPASQRKTLQGRVRGDDGLSAACFQP